eukprot:gene24132-32549_t
MAYISHALNNTGRSLFIFAELFEYCMTSIGEALQDSFYGIESFIQFFISNSKNIGRALFMTGPVSFERHGDVNGTSKSTTDEGQLQEKGNHTNYPATVERPFWSFPLIGAEILIIGIATVLPLGFHLVQRFAFQFTTFLFQTFISFPLMGIFDSSSIGGHLFLAIVIFYIAHRFFCLYLSKTVADRAVAATGLLIWIYLAAIDNIHRSVIVHNSQVRAFHHLLDMQSKGGAAAYLATPAAPQRDSAIALLDKLSAQLVSTHSNAFENTAFANIAIKAFWEVSTIYPGRTSTQSVVGGLGRYVSDSILLSLTAMLEEVPPGMGNMRIKSLSLGSSPPLIKGVRVRTIKVDEQSAYHSSASHSSDNSSKDTNIEENQKIYDRSYHRKDYQGFPKTTTTYPSERISAENLIVSKLQRLGINARFKISSFWNGFRNRITHQNRRGVGVGVGLGVSMNKSDASVSDRLIIDLDFVFVSKDLDFVATFRPADVQSLLPEAEIALTELSLTGILRVNMSLTHDYPFVGNTSFSFLGAPSMDFSISGFGGFDLGSFPLAYYWVNVTISWVLQQYTHPEYIELDLRHYFCPVCDEDGSNNNVSGLTSSSPSQILISSFLKLRSFYATIAKFTESHLRNVPTFPSCAFESVTSVLTGMINDGTRRCNNRPAGVPIMARTLIADLYRNLYRLKMLAAAAEKGAFRTGVRKHDAFL